MKIAIILFAFLWLQNNRDSLYYYKDIKCSFYFTTVKEYQLRLHENEFELYVQISDTRYKKNTRELLKGGVEYKGDTLSLNINKESSKAYYPRNVLYISKADSLVILKQDFIFPDSLRKIDVPILTPIFDRVQ